MPKNHKKATNRGWHTIRQTVLARDGHICQIALPGCTTIATAVDHIQPRARGGTDDLHNLRAACTHCNSSRGGRSSSHNWTPGSHP